MNLIILGAPGAGKGTQAEVIRKHLGIPSIATGDIIREAIKNQTELGRKAQGYVDQGKLAPDNVVIAIIKKRIGSDDCKNGFILDGFPRTIQQAQELDEMGVNIDKVIDIEVSDQRICDRIGGRRVCEDCGCSYHTFYKPAKTEGKCDDCGGKTLQRKDDAPETVLERLRNYHDQTEPLKEYYSKQNKLRIVEGQQKVEDTTALTLKALKE